MSTCAWPKECKPIHNGCGVKSKSLHHVGNRWSYHIGMRLSQPYLPVVHSNCLCNEYISIRNRVIGAVPDPILTGYPSLRGLEAYAIEVSRLIGCLTPIAIETIPDNYSGQKKRRYLRALDSLRTYPVNKGDSRVSAFIKLEKVDGFRKENPDPRMIQARTARYNLELAKFLREYEHKFYKIKDRAGLLLPRTRCVAKGLNLTQRANLLHRKWQQFTDPVCINTDASRWDQHVSKELLQLEHLMYAMAFNNDPELVWLLSLQVNNSCVTFNGIAYWTTGKRMSGDVNTGLGNSLLMVLCMAWYLSEQGFSRWDMLVDGDDCQVIVEREQFQKLDNICQWFLSYGVELKVESTTDVFEKISFCQTRPVEYMPNRFRMVCDPDKQLAWGLCDSKYLRDNTQRVHYIYTVGLCYLAVHSGLPVLQSYALALIRNARQMSSQLQFKSELVESHTLITTVEESGRSVQQLPDVESYPVSDSARVSFCLAYPVYTIEYQLWVERQLESWVMSTEFETRPFAVYPYAGGSYVALDILHY